MPRQRPQHPRREVVRSRRWLWALSRRPPGSFWAGRLGLRAPRTMWFWCGDDRVCPSHAGVCRHPVAAGGSPAAIPGGPLAPAPPVWSCFVAPRLGGRPHRGPRGGTLRTKLLVAQAGTRLPRRRGASSACVALSSALPARLFTEVRGAEGSTHRCGDTALPGRPWRSAQAGPQVPKGHASSCWVMASFFITPPPHAPGNAVRLVVIQSHHFLITSETSSLPKGHLTKGHAQAQKKKRRIIFTKENNRIPRTAFAANGSLASCAPTADSFSFQGLFFFFPRTLWCKRKRKTNSPKQSW